MLPKTAPRNIAVSPLPNTIPRPSSVIMKAAKIFSTIQGLSDCRSASIVYLAIDASRQCTATPGGLETQVVSTPDGYVIQSSLSDFHSTFNSGQTGGVARDTILACMAVARPLPEASATSIVATYTGPLPCMRG